MNYRDYEKEYERMKSFESASEWGIMDAENKVFAYDKFIQDQFTARLIQDDENFLIFDWRGKDTFNLSTRYILDKKKGSLIISGDSGDCIATWFNAISAKEMEYLVNSTEYFIGKIQASTNKYTYLYDDVKEDFDSWRKEIENEIDFDSVFDWEFEDDMERLLSGLLEYGNGWDNHILTDDVLGLIEKYEGDACESGLLYAGQRISQRIYLWTVGFQMGVTQLGLVQDADTVLRKS